MGIRFLLFCVLSMFFSFSSVASSSNKSASEVSAEAAIQKELATIKLPIAVGNVGEVSEITYSNHNLRLVMLLYLDDREALKNMPVDNISLQLAEQFSVMSEGIDEFGKDLSVTIVYGLKNFPGEELVISFSADELEKIKKTSNKERKEIAKKHLEKEAEAVNAGAPKKLDEYSILTKCSIRKNSFVYEYSITETDDLTLDLLKNNPNFRPFLESGIIEQGATVLSFLGHLLSADYTLSYVYKGTKSKKTFSIVFGKEDIERMNNKIKENLVE